MKRSDQINELAVALAKAQGQIQGAIKDAENPHFKSDYATLDSVWEACRAPLSSNGLSVVQTPSATVNGTIQITSLLLHQSGQWIESELELTPRDASPQAAGSAITYGRRYALMAMVGVAPVDDDDGNAANNGQCRPAAHSAAFAAPAAHKTPVAVQPLRAEPKSLTEPGAYVCKFGQKFNGMAIRDIAAADLRGYVKYLNDSAREQKKTLGGAVFEFVTHAEAYLSAMDPGSFQNFNEPGAAG